MIFSNLISATKPLLISGCLLGLPCRYDGKVIQRPQLIEKLKGKNVIPVCPEQLGGLSTPRPPAKIVGGEGLDVIQGNAKVLTIEERADVTAQFLRGAYATLQIAKLLSPAKCILKAKSPSCGLYPTVGVTAALLLIHGFKVIEIA